MRNNARESLATSRAARWVRLSCTAFAIVVGTINMVPRSVAAQTPVVWTTRTSKAALHAGSITHVALSASIAPGWYIYSLTQGKGGPFPLRITVPADQPFVLAGGVGAPAPDVRFDNNFKIDVETYSDSVTFRVPLKLAASAATDGATVATTAAIAVRYQACNATVCLPPQSVALHARIRVERTSGKHHVVKRVTKTGNIADGAGKMHPGILPVSRPTSR